MINWWAENVAQNYNIAFPSNPCSINYEPMILISITILVYKKSWKFSYTKKLSFLTHSPFHVMYICNHISLSCAADSLCTKQSLFFIWAHQPRRERERDSEREKSLSLFGAFSQVPFSIWSLLQHSILSSNFNHCCKKDEINSLFLH